MKLAKRELDGITRSWVPDDTQAAKEALANTQGTGVGSVSEVEANAPLDLGNNVELFERLNNEYNSLVGVEVSLSPRTGTVESAVGTEAIDVSVQEQDGTQVDTNEFLTVIVDGDERNVSLFSGEAAFSVETNRPPGTSVEVVVMSLRGETLASNTTIEIAVE